MATAGPYVRLSVWDAPGTERPTFKDATSKENNYRPAHVGDVFGPSWSTHWFRVELVVPQDMRKKELLELHWDANNEGMVWTEDGVPLQGLTGGGERVEWILPKSFRDGQKHIIYIEMACNRMFGNANGDTNGPPSPDNYYQLIQADIVAVNVQARGLFMDFWELGDAAREFPEDSWEEHEALQVGNRIIDAFIAGDGSNDSIVEGRKIAAEYLGSKVDSADVYDDSQPFLVNAIGHCHIDTCWLWPWAETKRKIARSWLNQCDLMERYPEHRFCASQAQQYKWLKTYYPTAFDRVKEKVKEGRFHPIGGSWVEHDTNMPSGESLVRQFLYGQRFFESHFGERSTTFWLPDTFGYSSQLPQICQLAGMTRFFTQKLSWNNINNFPHTTFNWVALDGSQVLCHMTPCNTYTSEADFGDVKRSITQHKSMDESARSLLVFGKGDGGGGPTWQHIEKLRRTRGMADKVGSIMPRTKMGESVDEFFERLEKERDQKGVDFVTWYGELYLELHRGCYTSQANNKRNNRKIEQLLHDIEYLATLATLKDVINNKTHGRYQYPKKDIDEMWENMLLCQFHDCLPGSAIEMCYDDSDALYEKTFAIGERLFNSAILYLGLTLPSSKDRDTSLVAINTTPHARHEIIKAPPLPDRSEYAYIAPYSDSTNSVPASTGLCEVSPIPAFLSTDDSLAPIKSSTVNLKVIESGIYKVENAQYSVRIHHGTITSLYSKLLERELVPKGKKMNQLLLFDDKPLYWQAWDVEVFHLRSRKELAPGDSTILERGPLRVAIQTHWQISSQSWIKTTISLTGVPYSSSSPPAPVVPLEISAEIEWREDKKLMKAEFPTTLSPLHNQFLSETQYGMIARPTHRNTSWDAAKFEVVAHRFSALHESHDGLAVLNDAKYGFAAKGSTMRLSVLRAPKAPDGNADMGRHYCRWGVLPFANGVPGQGLDRVVRAARAFNNPVALPFENGIGRPPPSDGLADEFSELDVHPQSNHNGTGNRGAPALFPFTSLTSYVFSAQQTTLPALAALFSCFTLTQPTGAPANLVLDTIKRGEDDRDLYYEGALFPPKSEKSIILRVYEALGSRGLGSVSVGRGLPVKSVRKVNVLEDEPGEVVSVMLERGREAEGSKFEVELRAWEVGTYRVVLDV